MSKRQIIVLGGLLLVFVSVWTAPVKEQAEKRSDGASLSDVEGEDEDLQELLNLVNKQTHQDDVMVHKEHVTHIENNNGKSVKVEQKEEKVVDTESGQVLADVKQQKQTDVAPGEDSEPQTVVETKVDIPSAGVHETFVHDEDQMSPEDAEAYAKAMLMEYERLEQQDLEEPFLLERKSYPQVVPDDEFYGPGPGFGLYPHPIGVPEYSAPIFDMPAYVNSDTVDPYEFLAALWNEAYEHGNLEAQEVVRLLYDRVSHDSNPDDMGEIRDILLDTVAQSLGEYTPYAFETPIDTPLALPQMSINEEEAELGNMGGVAEEPVEADEEEQETDNKSEDEEEEAEEEVATEEDKDTAEEKEKDEVEEKSEEKTEEEAEEKQ